MGQTERFDDWISESKIRLKLCMGWTNQIKIGHGPDAIARPKHCADYELGRVHDSSLSGRYLSRLTNLILGNPSTLANIVAKISLQAMTKIQIL